MRRRTILGMLIRILDRRWGLRRRWGGGLRRRGDDDDGWIYTLCMLLIEDDAGFMTYFCQILDESYNMVLFYQKSQSDLNQESNRSSISFWKRQLIKKIFYYQNKN
jgi:hypothetical protein